MLNPRLRTFKKGLTMLSRSLLRVKPVNYWSLARFQSTISKATTNGSLKSQSPDIDEVETYPEVEKDLYFYRDPDAPWDDVQNRRNVGQPLHLRDDELNLWSPHYYDIVPDSTAVRWQLYFFGTIGLFSAVMYTFFYPERNAVPRNYPDGLAKDLGARDEKDAYLYRVRVDKTYGT